MNHEAERSKSGSILVFSGVLWLLGTLAASYFEPELNNALWIMSVFVWGPILFGGLLIVCLAILGLFERRGWKFELGALFFVLPLMLMIGFQGPNWLYPARLKYIEIPRNYAPRLQAILAASPDQRESVAGNQVQFDKGSTLRVAFVEPGGILDNWSAIVYDPTGLVGETNSPEARKCFGGDLTGAVDLGGGWYRCVFT
jgi:hypothetical protein